MSKSNGSTDRRFSEAARYYWNAKELLKKGVVRHGVYDDLKPVREACGTLWLAVLEAADDALLRQHVPREKLPKSYEEYVKALAKHLAVRNGRLLNLFNATYDQVHIAGHYRGLLHQAEAVKAVFFLARQLIEKLSGRKIV